MQESYIYRAEGLDTCALTVQITGEPTEDNMDIQVRLAFTRGGGIRLTSTQSQKQERVTTSRSSVWLKGIATRDNVTDKWTGKVEMKIYTPEEARSMCRPEWRPA